MRRLFVKTCLIATVGAVVLGCGKDIGKAPEAEGTRTVRVSVVKAADTKTAIVEGENKASYVWSEGDQDYFQVYENDTKGTVESVDFSSDMKIATLNVSFSSSANSTTGYEYTAKFAKSFSSSKNPKLEAEQNPSATSYDPRADILISQSIIKQEAASSLQFQMDRKVTVNKMTLKGLEAGEKVSKVEFELDKVVAGYYNATDGSFSGSDKKITLNYSSLEVGSDGTFPVYFTCAPVTDASVVKIAVTTDKHVYTRLAADFSRTVTFALGKVSRFNVDMTGFGVEVSTGATYTLAETQTDLEEGANYIIAAADYDVAMGLFTGGSIHPSVAAAKDAKGKNIVVDNVTDAQLLKVKITKSGTSYLMQNNVIGDDYNGSYVAWVSGNSSVEQTDPYLWNITISEGVATIASAATSERQIQYNASSPRFACYTGSQKAVALFKESAPVPPLGISFDVASYSFVLNSEDYDSFTGQTVTKDASDTRTVTYAMSGDAIGTVNSATGAVTLDGTTAGSATVTASVAADETHQGGSVSYTITITSSSSNVDAITYDFIGISGTNYASKTGLTGSSGAVYSTMTAGGNNAVQMRSNNSNSGVVVTKTAGLVKKVSVIWNTNTASGRILQVYGKATAYSSPSDLYSSNSQGTLIGSFTYGSGNAVELEITDDYAYVGFRSSSGALYMDEIRIMWNSSDSGDGGDGGDGDEEETPTGWLGLPASTSGSDYFSGTLWAGSDRNYTYLYQYSTYTSLWTAYPLYASTIGSSTTTLGPCYPTVSSQEINTKGTTWTYNPQVDKDKQINVWSGSYGVNLAGADPADYYARGHQIPNSDRSSNGTMQSQTYYATNSTPQIQNRFNGYIWNSLEGAIRGCVSDTVYVVTGATIRTAGGSEEITYITPAHDSRSVPVPNYYWKVLLKVKWDNSGTKIKSASAIGFWLEHKQYSSEDYTPYVKSVAEIETLTGFSFFVNLPESLRNSSSVRTNTSWSTFKSF